MNKRLKALEKRVRKIEEWLTSRDASADVGSDAPSAPPTAGAATAPTGTRDATGLLPRGLSLSFDDARATITIAGIVYSYEFFRQLGSALPVGAYCRVLYRSGGAITIAKVDAPISEEEKRLAKIGQQALVGHWWYKEKQMVAKGAKSGFCTYCYNDVPNPFEGGKAAEHHKRDCPIPERP